MDPLISLALYFAAPPALAVWGIRVWRHWRYAWRWAAAIPVAILLSDLCVYFYGLYQNGAHRVSTLPVVLVLNLLGLVCISALSAFHFSRSRRGSPSTDSDVLP